MVKIEPPAEWGVKGAETLAWIERAAGPGARVVRIETMPPSATAKHVIDVALPDGTGRRLVLRRYHDAQRLERDPSYVPAHEAHALALVGRASIPAPRVWAADLDAVHGDTPALLETWLAGEPGWRPGDLEAYLAQAAAILVAIHALHVPADSELPRYAPYHVPAEITPPSFSQRTAMWELVLAVLRETRPEQRSTLIHRDYHPGNVLWDGARVTGVVDWATASVGPPGIDLARMRLNLASHHGVEAAERFVALYHAAGGNPSARQPFWDLLDAADCLPDLATPIAPAGGEFTRFEQYVGRVLVEARAG
jgi:aminoglycoside phosphotransferase (APT) family kinase protein